jgi:hypothetical protein
VDMFDEVLVVQDIGECLEAEGMEEELHSTESLRGVDVERLGFDAARCGVQGTKGGVVEVLGDLLHKLSRKVLNAHA